MPIAVFRSLAGMMSSTLGRGRRGDTAANPRAAWRERARAPGGDAAAGVFAGEALEQRLLFVLAVTPVPAATPATQLGAALLVPNTGITLTGGAYVGVDNQGGTYTGFDLGPPTGQRLSIPDGVLLTSGLANDALGPNDSPFTTTLHNTPGDTDLNTVVGFQTFDANSLTLTFTTDLATRSIIFDFIFGSDEYNEFVGSVFNDAFCAFLDGVQVSFDINQRPITVNNNFFRINNLTGVFDIEYDGLTPRIRTQAPLNPALTTHTLKFVVADTGDADVDSGVFVARLQGSTVALPGPITDLPNPGVIVLGSPTFTVDETGGTATILVNRVGGTSGQVTVDYVLSPGTVTSPATSPGDFIASAGTLVFADGQTSLTIPVTIVDDALVEGDETVLIALSNPFDAGLGFPNSGTLLILDNERAIQFFPHLFPVDETAGSVTLTVSRSGPLDGTVTVSYASSDGTTPGAAAQADYIPTSGVLTFAAGQRTATITVQIVPDFVDDEPAAETFNVTLANDVVGAGLGNQPTATVTINNIDRPPSIFDITGLTTRRGIEELYLSLNDPMQAARILDPANFDLYLHAEQRFNGPPSRRRVPIKSIAYDGVARRITLRPTNALRHNVFYEITVRSTVATGVQSAANEPLDGNLDRVAGEDFIGYYGRGIRLNYFDRNGDRVKLGTTGPAVLEVFRDVSRDARQVRLVGNTANASIWGKITQTWRGSDGVTDIGALVLGSGRSFLGNPPFRVGFVI
jgi:hypothetical protein